MSIVPIRINTILFINDPTHRLEDRKRTDSNSPTASVSLIDNRMCCTNLKLQVTRCYLWKNFKPLVLGSNFCPHTGAATALKRSSPSKHFMNLLFFWSRLVHSLCDVRIDNFTERGQTIWPPYYLSVLFELTNKQSRKSISKSRTFPPGQRLQFFWSFKFLLVAFTENFSLLFTMWFRHGNWR